MSPGDIFLGNRNRRGTFALEDNLVFPVFAQGGGAREGVFVVASLGGCVIRDARGHVGQDCLHLTDRKKDRVMKDRTG